MSCCCCCCVGLFVGHCSTSCCITFALFVFKMRFHTEYSPGHDLLRNTWEIKRTRKMTTKRPRDVHSPDHIYMVPNMNIFICYITYSLLTLINCVVYKSNKSNPEVDFIVIVSTPLFPLQQPKVIQSSHQNANCCSLHICASSHRLYS